MLDFDRVKLAIDTCKRVGVVGDHCEHALAPYLDNINLLYCNTKDELNAVDFTQKCVVCVPKELGARTHNFDVLIMVFDDTPVGIIYKGAIK